MPQLPSIKKNHKNLYIFGDYVWVVNIKKQPISGLFFIKYYRFTTLKVVSIPSQVTVSKIDSSI